MNQVRNVTYQLRHNNVISKARIKRDFAKTLTPLGEFFEGKVPRIPKIYQNFTLIFSSLRYFNLSEDVYSTVISKNYKNDKL